MVELLIGLAVGWYDRYDSLAVSVFSNTLSLIITEFDIWP